MRAFSLVTGLVGGLLLYGSAAAHHSQTMYDEGEQITLKGSVTRFAWLNPHSWIFVEVPDAQGQKQEWRVETFAATSLKRRGWSRDQMEVGDLVTVVANPRKDGATEAQLINVTLPDGQVLVIRGDAPQPAP